MDLNFYNSFLREPLAVHDGALLVPRRAGLGIAVDPEYLEAHQIS